MVVEAQLHPVRHRVRRIVVKRGLVDAHLGLFRLVVIFCPEFHLVSILQGVFQAKSPKEVDQPPFVQFDPSGRQVPYFTRRKCAGEGIWADGVAPVAFNLGNERHLQRKPKSDRRRPSGIRKKAVRQAERDVQVFEIQVQLNFDLRSGRWVYKKEKRN